MQQNIWHVAFNNALQLLARTHNHALHMINSLGDKHLDITNSFSVSDHWINRRYWNCGVLSIENQ